MNYRTICSSSVKNTIGVLIGIALNLQIALCSMVILTISILPSVRMENLSICLFHLSFTNILRFSKYRSLISLVRFIPRLFTLFDAIVHGIAFLISLSGSTLLMYRNATDFCINFVSYNFTKFIY